MRCARSVEPTRSQNNTVIWRRELRGTASSDGNGAPHCGQNRPPDEGVRQRGQFMERSTGGTSSAAPSALGRGEDRGEAEHTARPGWTAMAERGWRATQRYAARLVSWTSASLHRSTAAAHGPATPRHLSLRGALALTLAFTFAGADGPTGPPAWRTAGPTCNVYVSRTSVPAIAPMISAPLPGVHVSGTAPRPSLTARDGDNRPPFAVSVSLALGTRLP